MIGAKTTLATGCLRRLRRWRWTTAGSFLLLAALAVPSRAEVIRGQVVDARGRGVAGIPVALQWKFQDPPVPIWTVQTEEGARSLSVVTDATGRFEGEVDLRFAPLAIYALDHGGRRGAIFVVTAENAEREISLELRELVRVHGTFVDDEPDAPLTSSYIHVAVAGTRAGVASDLSTRPSFSVDLPPGEYSLRFSGTDRSYLRQTLTLKAGREELDFGELRLPLKPLARHYGKKPPPLTVADARGVDRKVRLEDFLGKWVLLEFWGHW